MKIKHLVQKSFETTHPHAGIDSVWKRLRDNSFLVVLAEGSFLGILTPSDIIESPHQLVIDCLHNKPRVNSEQDIESVSMLMKESQNFVLPLFDGDKFIGVVTRRVITDYLFEYRSELKREISEHTAELAEINEQLKGEIEKCKLVEEALLKAHEELEEKIKERTAELSITNGALWAEITERKKAEEQLKTSSEQLRSLFAHLQSIREEARKRLAREIHDDLGQVLTVLKMEFHSFSDRLSTEQEGVGLDTESINQLIDRAIDTTQRVCLELRPAIVDELGLVAAIEWQAKEIEKKSNIKYKITFEPQEIIVDEERSIVLFRIFQEVLNNVVRHAQATKVIIHLKEKQDRIILSIKDNGIGITDEQISDFKSLGLMGIRERVQFLGGSFEIRGIKDKGTTVTISLPLKAKRNVNDDT